MTQVAAPLPVLFFAAALLAASQTLAKDGAEDAPVSTARAAVTVDPAAAPAVPEIAPTAGPPQTVEDQIEAYLRSPLAIVPPQDGEVIQDAQPRKVHGEVSIAVGTGGYRSVYLRSDMPVSKSGTLSVAVEDTKFGKRGGYGHGYGGGYPYGGGLYGRGLADRQSLGIGLTLGGARSDALGLNCRSTLDPERPYADTPERRACLRSFGDAPHRMW